MGSSEKKRYRLVRVKQKGKEEKKEAPQRGLGNEAFCVVLCAAGLFLAAALFSHYLLNAEERPPSENVMGIVGYFTSRILVALLGWCSFVTVIWSFLLARSIWLGVRKHPAGWLSTAILTGIGTLVMAASCAIAFAVFAGS